MVELDRPDIAALEKQAINSRMINWYYRSRIAADLNSRRGELALRSVWFPRLTAIYIPVPKTAGSTVLSTLVAADGSPHLVGIVDHNTDEARHLVSAEHDLRGFWHALHDPDWFRFAFVRDPYARIVSGYLDKIASGRTPRFAKWLGLPPDVGLLDFLRRISEQEVDEMNRHWRPQSALISPIVKLDFLGRFERFNEDFGEVLDRLRVDGAAITERRTHQTSANTRLDLIGPEEKALIDRIYRDDFERFGYPKAL
jgi:hypothetical protein